MIEELETSIKTLEAELANPDLFTRTPEKFKEKAAELAKAQADKDALETRWLELEILQEEIAGS